MHKYMHISQASGKTLTHFLITGYGPPCELIFFIWGKHLGQACGPEQLFVARGGGQHILLETPDC